MPDVGCQVCSVAAEARSPRQPNHDHCRGCIVHPASPIRHGAGEGCSVVPDVALGPLPWAAPWSPWPLAASPATLPPMHRRAFLQNTAAPIAVAAVASRQAAPASSLPPAPCPAERGVCPEDLDAYFTEEKLRLAITPVDGSGVSFEVVAYNFPSWHPSPFMEDRFGKGWTEYETLKASRPLFAGHLFPKHPLWGYFNEAQPEWAEREIDAAHQHGIDGWLIDWYWHDGTMFYHEQLEHGF